MTRDAFGCKYPHPFPQKAPFQIPIFLFHGLNLSKLEMLILIVEKRDCGTGSSVSTERLATTRAALVVSQWLAIACWTNLCAGLECDEQ